MSPKPETAFREASASILNRPASLRKNLGGDSAVVSLGCGNGQTLVVAADYPFV